MSRGQALRDDAERDLADTVGWKTKPSGKKRGELNIPLHRFQEVATNSKDPETGAVIHNPIEKEHGVIFATYNTLWQPGNLERIQQWLHEGEGDPVILFDESHSAQGATPGDERADPTKTGAAVLNLQQNLPKARITYLSATMADKPENMGYMTRLGIWGTGGHFKDFGEFCSFVKRAGVSTMELVARELKASGSFVSRSLGMAHPDGTPISFTEQHSKLTPEMTEAYNGSADVWRKVLDRVDQELQEGNLDKSEIGAFKSAYWGAHQLFFRNLIASIKAPDLIQLMENEVADGRQPVLLLSSTNETAMNRRIAAGATHGVDLDDLDLTNKDMLVNFVRNHWPTQQTQQVNNPLTNKNEMIPVWKYTTDDGRVFTAPHATPLVVGSELEGGGKIASYEEVSDPSKVRVQQEVLGDVDALKIPPGLLDQIIWHFGPEQVAELTGRKTQLVINPQTDKLESRTRQKPKGYETSTNVNAAECRQLNDGMRPIALVSEAGSTGISLHCGKGFKSQKRRVGIIGEFSFNPKTTMQGIGRVNRSGQTQGPNYVLFNSPIPGERRFVGGMACKLSSMGAMQRGDRGSASSDELAKYDYDSAYGQAAILRTLAVMENPHRGMMGREDMEDWTEMDRKKLIDQFFNRLLCMPLDLQERYMGTFDQSFSSAIAAAKERGELNAVEDIKADKIRTDKRQVIYKDDRTGAGDPSCTPSRPRSATADSSPIRAMPKISSTALQATPSVSS